MSANFWDTHAAEIDPENFRGHDQYLEQRADYPYEKLVDFVKASKRFDAPIWQNAEDGAFGCTTKHVKGWRVSRDLLDSMCEILFLRMAAQVGAGPGELSLPMARILDIGAGYGRFAHRYLTAYPNAFVFCTDGVSLSSSICGRYLAHRHVSKACVLRPEDASTLAGLDLAVAIHSWPECTRKEIVGWLDKLAARRVPRLFVIPHHEEFFCMGGECFLQDIFDHGYRMEFERKRWPSAYPRTYCLFRLEA
jgi:hypothetical protein